MVIACTSSCIPYLPTESIFPRRATGGDFNPMEPSVFTDDTGSEFQSLKKIEQSLGGWVECLVVMPPMLLGMQQVHSGAWIPAVPMHTQQDGPALLGWKCSRPVWLEQGRCPCRALGEWRGQCSWPRACCRQRWNNGIMSSWGPINSSAREKSDFTLLTKQLDLEKIGIQMPILKSTGF